jgi:hypothetical protein
MEKCILSNLPIYQIYTFIILYVPPETEDVNPIILLISHAPVHKLTEKESRILAKPWITNGIRVSFSKKIKLCELYIKSKNDFYFSKFKTYSNKMKISYIGWQKILL